MGPLSAKQHREYLKLDAEEQRKNAAFAQEQQRKDQLHQLKLQEAAAKASQGMAHKEENHVVKLAEGSVKVPRINRQKLGLPSLNPLAGSEVLNQGQKSLPGMKPMGTDTVPAMLTPGEAVIPAPAAQNPKNKKAIKKMVQEGRKKNKVMGYADGTTDVQYYQDGTVNAVPAVDPFVQELINKRLQREAEQKALQVSDQNTRADIYSIAKDRVPAVTPVPGFNRFGNVKPVVPPEEYIKRVTPAPLATTPAPVSAPVQNVASTVEVPAITPALLQAQREQESGNRMKDAQGRYIVSKEGAIGTAQLIPATAYKPGFGVKPLIGEEIYDEAKQIGFQTDYMNAMYNRYKDTSKALTAYNAGPGTVDKAIEAAKKAGDESKWKDFLPTTEAKEYADRVLGRMNKDGRLGFKDPRIVVPSLEAQDPSQPEAVVVGAVPPVSNDLAAQEVSVPTETKNADLASWSQEKVDIISDLARTAPTVSKDPEEQKGWLANAISSLYNEKGTGLINDRELMRFALVAAGGMLTGGSVGGSLRFAAKDVLSVADRRQIQEAQMAAEQKRFTQQELMLDKRAEKEAAARQAETIRQENKQLESEMIKEGRDSVAVREWIKGGQKGEPPQIKTSFIRNGKSELMTVTRPTKVGDQVFKPGQPVWVYEVTQQTGNRKGETVQMARIGDKDVPFDSLMSQGFFLDKWDSSKYGDMAKLKRAQDFSDRLAEKKLEPIFQREFGASDVKGKPNPARQGVVTAGTASSQIESYFRNKVDLDDRATQVEIEKIISIAGEQIASDIKSGTFKSVNDITPYLAAGEFRKEAKLSDKLVTLDAKLNKLMSVDDILAMRSAVERGIAKNKLQVSPDAEIARLAEIWTQNKDKIQNKYPESSGRNTGFALFVLDFANRLNK